MIACQIHWFANFMNITCKEIHGKVNQHHWLGVGIALAFIVLAGLIWWSLSGWDDPMGGP